MVRAAVLAGATVAGASAVAAFWPWPLLHAAVAPPAWAAPEGPLQLSAPAGQAIYFDNAGVRSDPQLIPRWRTAHGRIHVSGLPDRWYAMAHLARGVLTFDGRTITSGASAYTVPLPRDDERRDTRITALEEALQVVTINGARLRDSSGAAPIMRVLSTQTPPDGVDGSYEGDFEVGLHEVQVAGVLAPGPGSRFQEGAYRLTVTGVRLTEGGPRLDVRTWSAASVFDRQPDPRFQVFLRNRRLGEALAGDLRSYTPPIPSPESVLLGRPGSLAAPSAFGPRRRSSTSHRPPRHSSRRRAFPTGGMPSTTSRGCATWRSSSSAPSTVASSGAR